MSDTVQQIKDRLSIVDVVGQYVKLERSGGSMRARCPFHAERTPSFFVSPDRGTYHCFGCSAGGDIFSFVEQIEGLDFKGALKVLAEKAGVAIVYEKKEERDSRERLFALLEAAAVFYASRLSDDARAYIRRRGISEETMHSFRLGLAGDAWGEASAHLRSRGFSEKEIQDAGMAKRGERGLYDRFRNRIMFPICDSAGRVVGFSGRIFTKPSAPPPADAPKYLNSPETELFRKSRILYGFDRAKQVIRKHNFAVLVEGQMDLLASHQAGWGNTVAVSGTAFTDEHANLLRRMTDNLVIALDADEAGIKAAGRAARAALRADLNVKVAHLPPGVDPADLIGKEGPSAWKEAIRSAKDIVTFLLDVLEEHVLRDKESALQKERFRRGVETAVLPFISDVRSPILREQYVQQIAARLGVREQAIVEALAKVPRESSEAARPASNAAAGAEGASRERQAFGLLLWQSTLEKPAIDVKEFETRLGETVGADALAILSTLPEREQESLRFSAERLWGKSTSLRNETNTLLITIAKDRLTRELEEARAALQRAEHAGNEEETRRRIEECKALSARIAKVHG